MYLKCFYSIIVYTLKVKFPVFINIGYGGSKALLFLP